MAAAAAEEKATAVRRTKLVRVKQGYIDCLLREPPPKVFDGVPEEIMAKRPDGFREPLRTAQAKMRACLQRSVDEDLDILAQYRDKGFAMVEVAVYSDDEDEEEDGGHAVSGAAEVAEGTNAGSGVAAHVGACKL